METNIRRVQEIPCWRHLCSLVVVGIYAFALSLIGGIILWASLEIGANFELGMLIVLAEYGIEIYGFITNKATPAILFTNLTVVILRWLIIRPAVVSYSRTAEELRCDMSWLMLKFRTKMHGTIVP